MVTVTVPVAMPFPGALRENVFLPVTTKMIISISDIVSIPEIVSTPEIVSIPENVSIPELHSGVSLVPHACDSWISVIREWGNTIALRDRCYRVWTRTGEGTSTRRNVRPPVRGRW
jgi:hypothetical protein